MRRSPFFVPFSCAGSLEWVFVLAGPVRLSKQSLNFLRLRRCLQGKSNFHISLGSYFLSVLDCLPLLSDQHFDDFKRTWYIFYLYFWLFY